MNSIEAVGHDIKVAAEDVAKGVAYPLQFLVKAESVIASAIKDQPAVRTAVLDLINKAQVVIADGVGAAADKGMDLASDAKTLADAESFFSYFNSAFIPLVEQIYAEVKTDVR
jgi:hypothetical protein